MKNFSFLVIALIQLSVSAQNFDIDVLRSVNIDRNPKLDQTFSFITESDAPISILIPATILTIGLIGNDSLLRRKSFVIGGSLFISYIVTLGMKYGIKRDRPFDTYPEIVKLTSGGSPSFPSGHTSMAFSIATSLSLAFPKWYVIAPAYLWASAVGYSRMHLGVHYPSDLFVGALIGSGSAFLSQWLVKKVYTRRKNKAILI